jgi:hypothetical protein
VVETLTRGRWGLYLLLVAPYSLFYTLLDALVLQKAVSWFNVPVAYRDILPIRASAYILSLFNTQLGQGGVAVYLHKRHHLPFWQVTSTVVFIAFVEMYQLAFYSFIGALTTWERRAPWTVYGVMAAYLVFHLWWFSRPHTGRAAVITDSAIFAAFRKAKPRHYLALLALKTPNVLAAVVTHWLALPLFGLHVPFLALLTYLPIIFFVAALPIAAAHLGPSQLAWQYFLSDYANGADLVAYSLAAHLTFMLMNALIGVLFLRRAARELADPAPGAAVSPSG